MDSPKEQPVLPVFAQFIRDLRAIWAALPDDKSRMTQAKAVMERDLLTSAALRAHAKAWPSTAGRKNLLFYEDPDYGFVINGVVREAGYVGGVHDHADAWVLYGLLEGTETLERFERVDDRSRETYAEIRLTGATQGCAGRADLVPPRGIHAEQGGPGRSVAVILRSRVLVGRVPQGRYDRETGAFSTGPGPEQIPYAITA